MFQTTYPKSTKSPVILLPHQIDHTNKIWKTITTQGEFSYVDSSRTGLGKTHVALDIAFNLQSMFGMKVGIIAPSKASLENDDGWLYWAKKYGVVIEKATTYAALRSRKMMVYDDWLCKNDMDKRKGYHASGKFEKLAQQGIFLIFDEFHMATRESSTHYACSALIRSCLRYPSRNRISLLSLTPGDQMNHYPQIARLCGIIKSTYLCQYNRSTRTYSWEKYGMGDMINSCVARGANRQFLLSQMDHLSTGRIKYLIGAFFKDHIKNRITFAMPIPENPNIVTTNSCFLECHPDDLKNLNESINRLCDGVNWNGYSADEKANWNIGQINVALKLIERYKLRTTARYIKSKLESQPDNKFIVSMGSRCTKHFSMMEEIIRSMEITVPIGVRMVLDKARMDPTNIWSRLNKDVFNLILNMAYKPKVDIMYGGTSSKDRVRIMRQFQAKKSESWCLLISPGVGDKSISLHDTHGNHPRELIIIPDFHHTRLTQSTGRTNRVGVSSDVVISIIYGKESRLETSIIKSMIRKSEVAKDMLAHNQTHLFPGNYDIYVENDKDDKIKTEIQFNI